MVGQHASHKERQALGLFERFLPFWILACMGIGLGLGKLLPWLGPWLDSLKAFGISIPIGLCIFLVLFPIFVRTKLERVVEAVKTPRPTVLATILVWGIKPFAMLILASLFLSDHPSYAAGLIILGAAPCTMLVLVWSMFAGGSIPFIIAISALYTIMIAIIYAPYASWLAGFFVPLPWQIVALCAIFFLAIPLGIGYVIRREMIRNKGENWLEMQVSPYLRSATMTGVLLLLLVLFALQGEVLISQPYLVGRVAAPFVLVSYLMFGIAYFVSRFFGLPYEYASVVAIVSGSNHFEVAIGVTSTVFGIGSAQAFATTVGPLLEIPLMMSLAYICLRTKNFFPAISSGHQA